MLVKDLMSWPVMTVFDTNTVGEAMDVMRNNNIRHLPVVDINQNLIGVVSETDLIKVFPNGRGLSTFESNLLARTPVSKVMKPKPISATPEEIVEQAALTMRTNRISCLPVLEDEKLVGLLSKNDIIDAFIYSLGLKDGGTRVTIKYKKKWGFLSELITFADQHSICIDNIVTFGKELVLKLKGDSQVFVQQLREAGYEVTNVSYIGDIGE